MDIESLMSDKAILAEIGHRLQRRRVKQELTQADLAKESGVSKRTVERVETGESTQTATLIRILRVLELLEALNRTIPKAGPSPIDMLKLGGKERQRALSKKRTKEQSKEEWSWGEET